MKKQKFSDNFEYKGWFFACPVYINIEEINGEEGVECAARWESMEWWFTVNAVVCNFMISLLSSINPDYEPAFPFRITGKIRGDKIDKIN